MTTTLTSSATLATAPLATALTPGPQGSSLLWPWVWVAILVVTLAVGALAWWLARRRRAQREAAQETLWVANSAYLAQVPAFTAWVRRYRALQVAGVVALLVAVVGAGAVASRPVQTDVVVDRLGTRDIVLCLDVSGSMMAYDGALLKVYSELVKNFEGERIALSIFNSTSRTVFPLTDDYTLAQDQLKAGIEALDTPVEDFDYSGSDDADILQYANFTAGTLANKAGASLIGDGLANCALQFDEEETERSRSIILATDNYVAGDPIYTLQEAADLVASRNITLHGLYGGGDLYRGTPEEQEYRRVVEDGGGLYFLADDPGAVQGMVDDVVAQQAVELDASPEVIVTDLPALWFLVTTAGVVLLLLVLWRVRE